MQITAWLRGLGLERYEQAFLANDIDLELLLELDDAELEKIGVTSLGARKKILKARNELDKGHAPTESPVAAVQPAAQAERRQLTVMFVDLVGSTSLSARLDPEEMGNVIRAYQNAVAGEIGRLEGHVAKFMGDGVLGYFGWPSAHEDEAERSVRAGLAIVKAVAALDGGGAPQQCRVGIATGLVVVGELFGEEAAQERTVVGDTPNLAARLQAIAAAGQVVIAASTRRLLGTGFILEELDERLLKGIPEPVAAFAVTGERALESRFEAMRGSRLGAIVGREHELSLLQERWRRAANGEGQLVLLTGEAGIGKSRITRGLIDAVAGESHIRISLQCSPYHADTALYPVVQQISRAAKFADADSDEVRLDKLEHLLVRGSDEVAAMAPLMAALLGVPFEERYGPLGLPPERLRSRTLQMLVEQITGLAARQPVLFVVEDAHWIDPTTLEFLDLCLDRIATTRVMLLVTARPVFRHGFAGHPIVTTLALNRLGRAETGAIIARLTGGKSLPDEVVAEIVAKTDGVPLFIEELTKTALETGLLRETANAFVLDGPLSELAIPASLHDSLMARLDRMQPVKEIAQTAACIGREFDHTLLVRVASQPEPTVREALERLAAAELIFRRGLPPDASYLFKHALVRDAAYESLLKSARRETHRRILEALAGTDALPQILGYHAREAGLIDEAIDHYREAGRRALARPAYIEAIANLKQAVELLQSLGDDIAMRQRELEIRIEIGQASIGGYGYGAAETGEFYRAALTLLREGGESELWMPVYYGNWGFLIVRAEHRQALQVAEEMVERAAQNQDDAAALVSNRVRGASEFMMGRTAAAAEHLTYAWKLYEPARHRKLASVVSQEPGVSVAVFSALCLGSCGLIDQAYSRADMALSMAKASRHPMTIAYAQGHMTMLWLMLRDAERASALLDETLTYSETNSIKVWHVWSRAWQVPLRSLNGRFEEAVATIDELRPVLESTGTLLYQPLILSGELQALLTLGRLAECEERLRQLYAWIEKSGEAWNLSDIHRLEGGLRLAQNDPAAAEHCYRVAIDVASQQVTKLYELRASHDLAQLLAEQGERQKAHDLLFPVYDGFTEGFGAADLTEAKRLLDEL